MVFQMIKAECSHTLEILLGDKKDNYEIDSIAIAWESGGQANTAFTHIKDDEVVRIHLDALFNRGGMGHLDIIFKHVERAVNAVPEKPVQQVETSDNSPPAYPEEIYVDYLAKDLSNKLGKLI
jgi:hypothetical protein